MQIEFILFSLLIVILLNSFLNLIRRNFSLIQKNYLETSTKSSSKITKYSFFFVILYFAIFIIGLTYLRYLRKNRILDLKLIFKFITEIFNNFYLEFTNLDVLKKILIIILIVILLDILQTIWWIIKSFLGICFLIYLNHLIKVYYYCLQFEGFLELLKLIKDIFQYNKLLRKFNDYKIKNFDRKAYFCINYDNSSVKSLFGDDEDFEKNPSAIRIIYSVFVLWVNKLIYVKVKRTLIKLIPFYLVISVLIYDCIYNDYKINLIFKILPSLMIYILIVNFIMFVVDSDLYVDVKLSDELYRKDNLRYPGDNDIGLFDDNWVNQSIYYEKFFYKISKMKRFIKNKKNKY